MAAAPLTPKARAALRARAHDLKPLLHVGKEGVTAPLIHALSDAFRTRDLLKLKVLETAPDDARSLAQELVTQMDDVEVVQVMGRTVTLYRPLPQKPGASETTPSGRGRTGV